MGIVIVFPDQIKAIQAGERLQLCGTGRLRDSHATLAAVQETATDVTEGKSPRAKRLLSV